MDYRGQPYVLAVRSNHTLRFLEDGQLVQRDPATMAGALDETQWRTLSAGGGAKVYDWARFSLGADTANGFERWLLVRRHRRDRAALAYSFVHAPAGTDLAELAGAAGPRWTIEECFLRAKDDLNLDHCEARSWHGWHRHMNLVMAAAAFLATLAAEQRRAAFGKRDKPSPQAAVS